MKKLFAAALSLASAGAFAADAGTPTMDVTSVVASINGVGPNIVLVGGAVLAVAAVTFGYRTVRSFIGR
ncbi:major capsid protein [Burkholderia pseudomallei]|uniref:Membrane protein n=1 Tax=Burkholderia pseudomallei TaxID=28450 RepID=A0AA40JDN1_BURPE|nr:major capsid protein [Burkholderia pseudomallei]AGR69466.1 putative membrane protein [Burkholderia pseudomallei MSHR305]AHK69214.1 putative membrane protein [Burkholderia pseudomallei MSHR520]AIP82171.1 putative membrane protein [Burkholderia pseudomallei]AIS87234.1 putative membrane protein [Burkholderia pseudomallei NAU35A-3]AJX78027.1 putative membrane protein [Burkholderia pseudomallei MSHR2543]